MVKYLFEKNIIIYTFLGICALGLLLRLTVNLVYKHLVKESDRLGETKNKMLTHMKMKFATCFKLKIGVNNVDTFVDKSVLKYRFCGVLLSTWENASGQVLFLNLLLVPVATVFGVAYDCGQNQVLLAGAVGILTSAVLILVDISINLSAKKRLLRINLLDYLENFCKVRLEQEIAHPELVEQYRKEYNQALEASRQAGAAAQKAEPKDELNRRREARLRKEEEKRLQAQRRAEEQRKAEEARRAEEQRRLEERRQLAAKRREEERLRMEEERAALEARRAELRRKAEEKQRALELKQQKAAQKESLLHSFQDELKPTDMDTNMDPMLKEIEEITLQREQIAATIPLKTPSEATVKEAEVKEATMEALKEATEEAVAEKQKEAVKTAKSRETSILEDKLIEDVLREFFA